MRHSKASLFLMEIMISILFFSITAAVCIQLFVKAHTINVSTENLSKATYIAQDLSEYYLSGNPAGNVSMKEQMMDHLPPYKTDENHIVIYFSPDWKVCHEEAAKFSAELIFHEDGEYSYMSINLSELGQETPIYSNCVKKHIPRRVLS